MARLLFKLAQVPDDEAGDIRDLLEQNHIRFYETTAGFFRVGLAAIWLVDNSQEEEARALIHSYQQQRAEYQRATYASLVEAGQAPTMWQFFCAQPVRFLLLVLAIVFVTGLTLVPFLILLKIT